MPRVVHFELPAEDPNRAVAFYSTVFDWKIQKWEGPMDYWLVGTGENGTLGIDGAIMKAGDFPARTPVNTIDVPSVDEYLVKITDAGGEIVMPKHEIPSVGFVAYAKDTEGTIFGIIQFVKPATEAA